VGSADIAQANEGIAGDEVVVAGWWCRPLAFDFEPPGAPMGNS